VNALQPEPGATPAQVSRRVKFAKRRATGARATARFGVHLEGKTPAVTVALTPDPLLRPRSTVVRRSGLIFLFVTGSVATARRHGARFRWRQ